MSIECPIRNLRKAKKLPLTQECKICDGGTQNIGIECLGPIEEGQTPLSTSPFVRANVQDGYPKEVKHQVTVFLEPSNIKDQGSILEILARTDLRNSLFKKIHNEEKLDEV